MPYKITSDPDGFYVQNTDTDQRMNKEPLKTRQEAVALKQKLDASEGLGKGKMLPKTKKKEKVTPQLPQKPRMGENGPSIMDLLAAQGPPQGSPMGPGGPMMAGNPMMGPGGPGLPGMPMPRR